MAEEAAPGQGRFSFGMRGSQLASMAMTFGDAFVLQSAASNLLQLRDGIQRGLRHAGPALFSVYAPADGECALPGYLAAASAMAVDPALRETLAVTRDAIDKFHGDHDRFPASLQELVDRRYARLNSYGRYTDTKAESKSDKR